jgi:uncharacterized protein YndB with AHSA1/START domain
MEVSRVIAASPSTVWMLLARPEHWPDWGPSVRAVECNDEEIRVGTRGRVRTAVGAWLPFTITAVEHERAWDWQVAGFAATGHRLDAVDEHHTRVVFTMPVWALPYGVVCKLALRNLARITEDPDASHAATS